MLKSSLLTKALLKQYLLPVSMQHPVTGMTHCSCSPLMHRRLVFQPWVHTLNTAQHVSEAALVQEDAVLYAVTGDDLYTRNWLCLTITHQNLRIESIIWLWMKMGISPWDPGIVHAWPRHLAMCSDQLCHQGHGS